MRKMNLSVAESFGVWQLWDELENHDKDKRGYTSAKLVALKAIVEELENDNIE